MSVGTREARVGSRSMRSFISTNRDYAYTCLFEVFRNSKYVFMHFLVRQMSRDLC